MSLRMGAKKKFYQTDTFKTGIGVAAGILIYKIVTAIFFQ
jgi:hypothetical protein